MIGCLSMACVLSAQVLRGVVYDLRQEQGVAGASLHLLGTWQQTHSDSSGRYDWSDLPTGTQHFLITAPGYLPILRSAYLGQGAPTLLNAALAPAPFSLLGSTPVLPAWHPIDPLDEPAMLYQLDDTQLATAAAPLTPERIQALPALWLIQPAPTQGYLVSRGLSGPDLTYLLDGIRLRHSAHSPSAVGELGLLDPSQLAHVLLSPGAALPQAHIEGLGGSLHLFSHAPQYRTGGPAWGAQGQVQLQVPGQIRQGRFETRYENQRLALRMGLSGQQADDRVAGGDSIIRESAWRSRSLDFTLRQRLGEGSDLTLAYQQVQQPMRPDYLRRRWAGDSLARYRQRSRTLSYLRWTRRSQRPWWQSLSITTSLQRWLTTRERGRADSTLTQRQQLLGMGLNVHWLSRPAAHWEVRSGLLIYRDLTNEQADSLLQPRLAGGGAATLFWVYQRHRWAWGRWWLFARGQVQAADLSLTTATFGDQLLRAAAADGSLGLTYRWPKQRRLFARLGVAHRLPDLQELSRWGPQTSRMVVPNPELGAARRTEGSLGYQQRGSSWAWQGSLWGRYAWDLFVLQPARYRNSDQYLGLPVWQTRNQGQQRSVGGELSVEWQRGPWRSFAQASAVLAQNQAENWLRRLPPWHGQGGLRYERDGLWLQASVQAAAAQRRLAPEDLRDPRIPPGGSPAWVEINLSGGYTWAWGRVWLEGLNLADAWILPHGSGLPRYGRRVALGLMAWY